MAFLFRFALNTDFMPKITSSESKWTGDDNEIDSGIGKYDDNSNKGDLAGIHIGRFCDPSLL